jgi:Xaa-Pro aminopeptidase
MTPQPQDGAHTMHGTPQTITKPIPFDTGRLDQLLAEADIDVLVVTSKHNIQYLLGGYRFFFFEYMDAIGVSRYLPVLVYQRGKPESSGYVGCRMEGFEKELDRFWTPTVMTSSNYSKDAMQQAVEHIKKLDGKTRRVGIETAFLPADAEATLRRGLPESELVDAIFPLERLRLRKTPEELAKLRNASDQVVDAMLATFRKCAPGMTKNEIVEILRREEVNRGLSFDYCLITAGSNQNRAPSDQRLKAGDIISLDSGGNFHGYIGDLCRMGVLGEPDRELQDLLGFIEEVQQAARKPIAHGARGGDIYAAAEDRLETSPHREYVEFLAHGMGLVSHEAPRLTSTGPVPYDAYDAPRPLESGMVVSIETTMKHPKRGFIKLEDTVAVTGNGYEAYGDVGRGWNRIDAR